MKREDLAVTYLWVVGLESILAFLFGVVLFSESCTPARIAGVALTGSSRCAQPTDSSGPRCGEKRRAKAEMASSPPSDTARDFCST
ncbi:MAG TPA: hypothetical protein VFQ31_03055, partial [Methyloceanibacter sp.]|nr:hypothetical protein [Methyloceanibacter sp.]